MRKHKHKHVLAAAVAALSLSGVAVAHEAGDVVLRVGVVHASPDVDSSRIRVNGTRVRGTGVDVRSDTGVGVSGTYMIMRHFGIEAMATTPFTHRVKYDWGRYTYDLGKVSRLSPTVNAQFFFLSPKSRFQPYVGLGMNYTMFYNEKLSREAKENRGASDFTMKNSIGVVPQVGLDYKIGNHLSLNAAILKMGMSSKVEWKEYGGAERLKADVDINPWVYTLGVGFRF